MYRIWRPNNVRVRHLICMVSIGGTDNAVSLLKQHLHHPENVKFSEF